MNRINTIRLFNQLVGVITLVLLICSSRVWAQTNTGWMNNSEHPPVNTRFVLTGQGNPSDHTVEGFLEVKLDDGWKTYWRSPGEGGVAPKIDWQGSSNLTDNEWHWPYPKPFELLGIHTLGYENDVVIPLTLHVEDWHRPVELNATLTLSSCETVCVLTDYPFSLVFTPEQLDINDGFAFQYAQAISQVPRTTAQILESVAHWDQKKRLLEVSLTRSSPWSHPEFIVDSFDEQGKEYSFKPLSTRLENNKATVTFEVSSWKREINVAHIPLTVTVKDQGLLAETDVAATLGALNLRNLHCGSCWYLRWLAA